MISKALVREASVIAMDEPTAALSGPESEQLFSIVRDLTTHGVAILYVSHRLDEVLGLCDQITVFRNGRVVERAIRGDLDKKGLIRAIVGPRRQGRRGSPPDNSGPNRGSLLLGSRRPTRHGGEERELRHLSRRDSGAWRPRRRGGRTEVARLAFGADRLQGGHFEVEASRSRSTTKRRPSLSELRLFPRSGARRDSCSSSRSGLTSTLRRWKHAGQSPRSRFCRRRRCAIRRSGSSRSSASRRLASRPGSQAFRAGNQQKALIARWLRPGVKILILDEPSRGGGYRREGGNP